MKTSLLTVNNVNKDGVTTLPALNTELPLFAVSRLFDFNARVMKHYDKA